MQNPAEGELSKSSSSFCGYHSVTRAVCLCSWSGSASVASHHPSSTHTHVPRSLLLFPVSLQAPPSPSPHMTFRWPIRRVGEWLYGRTLTAKHKLQSHSPPPPSIFLLSFPPLVCVSLSFSLPLFHTPYFHSRYFLLSPTADFLLPPFLPAALLAIPAHIPPFPNSTPSFHRSSCWRSSKLTCTRIA